MAHRYWRSLPPRHARGRAITYRESGNVPFCGTEGNGDPRIHMPRWASRITLEVTEVRVQRFAGHQRGDAEAEGVQPRFADGWPSQEHIGGFYSIWASIHGLRPRLMGSEPVGCSPRSNSTRNPLHDRTHPPNASLCPCASHGHGPSSALGSTSKIAHGARGTTTSRDSAGRSAFTHRRG